MSDRDFDTLLLEKVRVVRGDWEVGNAWVQAAYTWHVW